MVRSRRWRRRRSGPPSDPNGGVGGLSFVVPTPGTRPALAVKNSDDAIFETYLQHKNITGHFEHEARNVWALYKTLTNSKPLKDATRDDGRLLVAHFDGRGLKSATIEKKIAWLKAATNLAIKEGRLKFNPFSSVVPNPSPPGKKKNRFFPREADCPVRRPDRTRLERSRSAASGINSGWLDEAAAHPA